MAAPMCEADGGSGFEKWLGNRLTLANSDVDADIFVQYINSILETDSAEVEKRESLLGVVGGITDDGIDSLCDDVMQKWTEFRMQKESKKDQFKEDALTEMFSKQVLTSGGVVKKDKQLSKEAAAQKVAILAQYGNVCDETDNNSDKDADTAVAAADARGGSSDCRLMQNVNKAAVMQGQRERREKMKQDHAKKKEKDKQDREMQRQKQQEKKDVEKKRTQKGERRR